MFQPLNSPYPSIFFWIGQNTQSWLSDGISLHGVPATEA
jgi:hypothetical protein